MSFEFPAIQPIAFIGYDDISFLGNRALNCLNIKTAQIYKNNNLFASEEVESTDLKITTKEEEKKEGGLDQVIIKNVENKLSLICINKRGIKNNQESANLIYEKLKNCKEVYICAAIHSKIEKSTNANEICYFGEKKVEGIPKIENLEISDPFLSSLLLLLNVGRISVNMLVVEGRRFTKQNDCVELVEKLSESASKTILSIFNDLELSKDSSSLKLYQPIERKNENKLLYF